MSKKNQKKGQKVDINTFLADTSDYGGDWADDFAELPTESASLRLPVSTGLDAAVQRRTENNYGSRNNNRREGGYNARPQAEIPDAPPFTAFVGGLAMEVIEDDVKGLFSAQNVVSIRLIEDDGRPKGFGYVEFGDRQSLVDALNLNGTSLQGRNVRIDVAGPQTRNSSAKPIVPEGEWRRADSAPRHSTGGYNRNGPSTDGWNRRSGPQDFNRGTMADSRPSLGPRKKLQLEPRTKPVEEIQPAPEFVSHRAADEPQEEKSSKPNPFGAAVPRDENEILKKLEEKRTKRQEEEEEAKKAKEAELKKKQAEESAAKTEETTENGDAAKDTNTEERRNSSQSRNINKFNGDKKQSNDRRGPRLSKTGEPAPEKPNVLDNLPQVWRRGPNDEKPALKKQERQPRKSINGEGTKRNSTTRNNFRRESTKETEVDKSGFQPANKSRNDRRQSGKPQVFEKEAVDVSSKNAFDLLNDDN